MWELQTNIDAEKRQYQTLELQYKNAASINRYCDFLLNSYFNYARPDYIQYWQILGCSIGLQITNSNNIDTKSFKRILTRFFFLYEKFAFFLLKTSISFLHFLIKKVLDYLKLNNLLFLISIIQLR